MYRRNHPYFFQNLVLKIWNIKHSYSVQNRIDLEYKALDKKRANAQFAANRIIWTEKFGSIIFCRTSFNSRIESANYSKQMELYISKADLSELDTAIKDYENERSKCRD